MVNLAAAGQPEDLPQTVFAVFTDVRLFDRSGPQGNLRQFRARAGRKVV